MPSKQNEVAEIMFSMDCASMHRKPVNQSWGVKC